MSNKPKQSVGERFTPKKENIDREKERLKGILSSLSEEKMAVANGLIVELSFMRATLMELRAFVKENGVVDEMSQGSYSIIRESPAIRTYNAMISKYVAICKQLFDMLPADQAPPPPEKDEFEEFIEDGRRAKNKK